MEELKDLFLNCGIYSKKKVDRYDAVNVGHCKSLDLFCPNCKANKTFIPYSVEESYLLGSIVVNSTRTVGAIREVSFKCPTCELKVYYSFYYDGEFLHKLAQYPSLKDVSRDELKQYEKSSQIDKESFKEINKAYECASSGFFVAAYTYLRRVFENLLLNLFKTNQETFEIGLGDFDKLRFDEKLELLKEILAIEDSIYKPLYSLLSEGIHSLSEDECENYFNLLKFILLDILAEQKAKEEKAKNRKNILDLYAKKKAEGKKDD